MVFFDNYCILHNNNDSVLANNMDGVYHGNILEFIKGTTEDAND